MARRATGRRRASRFLAAIATSLGFSTQSYFTKVFREHIGFTPSEFRKRFFRESDMGGA